MRLTEIFTSIEGEGRRSGQLVTFVRFAGCNLNCSYCDTKYSCDFDEGEYVTPKDVFTRIEALGLKKITLTGGEPLRQPYDEMLDLLSWLRGSGCEVNIETNGSVDIGYFYTSSMVGNSTFFTVDYKCPSSGMEDKMCWSSFKKLHDWDVVKFVVQNREDLDKALQVTGQLVGDPQIFISPVFDKINPQEIVQYMKDHKIQNWRLQLQMHKLIWDPDERGV